MQCILERTTFSLAILKSITFLRWIHLFFSCLLPLHHHCFPSAFWQHCLTHHSVVSFEGQTVSPSLFARIPDVSEAFWAPGNKQLRQPQVSEHFAREPGEQRTDKGSTCLWVWNSLGPWIECKYTLKILLSDTLPASSGLLSWKIFQLRSFSQQKTRI